MTYILAKAPGGARGLYVDGDLVATWGRKESLRHIERQLAVRSGSMEVEYVEREVSELADRLDGDEGQVKRGRGRPRSPKNIQDDPSAPSPARVAD